MVWAAAALLHWQAEYPHAADSFAVEPRGCCAVDTAALRISPFATVQLFVIFRDWPVLTQLFS